MIMKTVHIKNTGQIVNKGKMRKLPGGGGGANGANKATCQGSNAGKNFLGKALPLLPLAKVRPWMQPINCLVENLHTKPCFTR